VDGRQGRRAEARAGVAEAECKVRCAKEAARLVEPRRLLKAALLFGDVHALIQRYEGHNARQMADAHGALNTVRRAKSARSAGRPNSQEKTADAKG
jgi:hypothetical protein